MRKLQIGIITSILVIGNAFSQHDGITPDLLRSVRAKIKDRLGSLYRLQSIVRVDSAIGNPRVADGDITDPYGTLGRCVLFLAKGRDSAEAPSKGFVGVMKNEDIVWISDGLIDGEGITSASISRALDLNRDGNVEIVTSWYWGMQDPLEYLWIVRWDGHQGTIINGHKGGRSAVVSEGQLFVLVDVDGDGIMEIKGDLREVRHEGASMPIYRWNGQAYVEDSGPLPEALPRDKVDIDLRVRVTPLGHGYMYRYQLTNLETSLQEADDFCLQPVYGLNLTAIDGRPGWRASSSDRHVRWTNSLVTLGDPNFLKPGETDTNFVLGGTTPPALTHYYVQGHNGDSFSGVQIVTNSAHGLTLGPSTPVVPFVPTAFIDTIESYKHQAISAGWIKNQGIATSLDQKLSDAKLQLQKENTASARNILRAFLNEVEALNKRGDQIAGEAYALLKFNAEYLMGKLSEK